LISRRSFIRRLGFLAAGAAGVLLLRDRVLLPAPGISFHGSAQSSGWIGFPDTGLIQIAGSIGGVDARVLVDSGAQFSAIDRGLANRLGLKAATPAPMIAYGVTGGPTLTHTVGLDLQLPGLRVEDLRAAVFDLASLSAMTRTPFDLLLGRDVLGSLILEVDGPGRRVALMRPEAYAAPVSAVSAATVGRGGALLARVGIEAAQAIEALVDTGASAALALSAAAATNAGLLHAERNVARASSVGLGGLSVDRIVLAQEVRLAGFLLRDVPVQIFTPARGGPIPSALLGMGLLRRFRFALDHDRSQMHLALPKPP
jgi:predicted aspartyl protease